MVPSNCFGLESGDNFAVHSNRHNQVIIQIERAEALSDKVENIVQVDGISILFIGISDCARAGSGFRDVCATQKLIEAESCVSQVAREPRIGMGYAEPFH